MRLRTSKNRMLAGLQPVILCLALVLAACSHDTVTATQPVKTETAAALPEVIKPDPALPAALEPTKPEPVAEKPGGNAVPNKISVLKPGQSAHLDESTTLHYVRLVSDSRCPVNVQCIWAGEATIEMSLESGSEKQTFTLSDRTNTKEVMGFGIELVSIDRAHLINIQTRKL